MRSFAPGFHTRAEMHNLRTGEFVHDKKGTTSRVSANIDGTELWFESDDVDLEPSAEALATLWLIPALLSKRNLEIEQPVCSTWYENAHKVMNFLDHYWAAAPVQILANSVEKTAAAPCATGLFFTCGVDSFHSLFTISKPDFLIHIETFEIPSDNENRARLARERLEKVARLVGSSPITVRTNIKKHPTFTPHRFADTHAAVLASVGHMLAPYMGSITIAPSWHRGYLMVFGSHWQLDPLWSSARIKFSHGDNTGTRHERTKAIAGRKLVQEHLHVCFQNQNCSRCEKCVRTMLDLHQAGKLAEFKVFDHSIPIWEAIDGLPKAILPVFFEPALNDNPQPEVERALRHLFRRTSLAATATEDQLKQRRYVDEQFPKIEEGLNNALHHYALLQQEHKRLSDDYAAIVGNLPIKNCIRLVRKVARKLRGSDANSGMRTTQNAPKP